MRSPRAGQGPCGSVELLCCSPFPGQGHAGMARGTELVLPMGAALPGHRPCPALLGQSPHTPITGTHCILGTCANPCPRLGNLPQLCLSPTAR